MSDDIVSDHPPKISPLSSHEGLTSKEILQDCLEKAQALLSALIFSDDSKSSLRFHQLLSLLDDLVCLALGCCESK